MTVDIVQVFALLRRIAEISLEGLDPRARYEVTFSEAYEVTEKRVMTGAALGNLRVEMGSTPGVMLIRYRKINAS